MQKGPTRGRKQTSAQTGSKQRPDPASIAPTQGTAAQSVFDADGWASGKHARTGVGLGNDAANRLDRNSPGRQFTGKEKLPRFGGKVTGGK